MLKKLLKHDFLSTYKKQLNVYIMIIIASAVLPLVFRGLAGASVLLTIVGVFSLIALFGIYFGAFILTLMTTQKLLFDSFYKPQGYLTFTLPFPLKKILFSKIIVAFAYIITYLITTILGVLIIAFELPLIGDIKYETIFKSLSRLFAFDFFSHTVLLSLLIAFAFYLFILVLIPLSGALAHSKVSKKNNERKAGLISALIIFIAFFVFSVLVEPFATTNITIVQIVTAIYYLTLGIGGFFLAAYLMDYRIDIE